MFRDVGGTNCGATQEWIQTEYQEEDLPLTSLVLISIAEATTVQYNAKVNSKMRALLWNY
jgi:hypothetical protein